MPGRTSGCSRKPHRALRGIQCLMSPKDHIVLNVAVSPTLISHGRKGRNHFGKLAPLGSLFPPFTHLAAAV